MTKFTSGFRNHNLLCLFFLKMIRLQFFKSTFFRDYLWSATLFCFVCLFANMRSCLPFRNICLIITCRERRRGGYSLVWDFSYFPALPLPISLGPDKFLDMLSCYNYLQLFPNLQLINPIASVINFPRLRECLELEMLRYVSPFPFLPVSCLPVHR